MGARVLQPHILMYEIGEYEISLPHPATDPCVKFPTPPGNSAFVFFTDAANLILFV